MLFGVLKHLDSLREVEIGMKAEVNKLHHLGMDYVIRRSMLADANKRRPQEFFVSVYAYLLEPYSFLADSSPKDEKKTWNLIRGTWISKMNAGSPRFGQADDADYLSERQTLHQAHRCTAVRYEVLASWLVRP